MKRNCVLVILSVLALGLRGRSSALGADGIYNVKDLGAVGDGTTNIGRLNIENVFIICARQCGVYVTKTYDIPTLRNIEVWNARDMLNMAEYCPQNCVAFKLGRNDEIRMHNYFAFKRRIGYLFVSDNQGQTRGGMTACSPDLCVEGIVVEAADSLRVNGGCLWVHHTAIRLSGPAKTISVNGVDMKANGDAALIVRKGTNAPCLVAPSASPATVGLLSLP